MGVTAGADAVDVAGGVISTDGAVSDGDGSGLSGSL